MRFFSWLRRSRKSELLYDRGASGHFNHVHWAMNRTGRAEVLADHLGANPPRSGGSGQAASDDPSGQAF